MWQRKHFVTENMDIYSVGRIFGFCVFAVICGAQSEPRFVMLYNAGSNSSFADLWNTPGSFNDETQISKSNQDIKQLLSLDNSNFKAEINSTWGNISHLELVGYNMLGEELCYAIFEVAGLNITTLDTWFQTAYLLDTSIGYMHSAIASLDNKELLLLENTNEAWFSIIHELTDTRIVLAVNSSSPLTVDSIVSDVVDEGCWAHWELDVTLSFTDAAALTVDACVQSCTTPYIALQLGQKCFCGDFLTQHSEVTSMCSVACPGDSTFKCGGSNVGYYSVYSGTFTNSELDVLPLVPESAPLVSFSHFSEFIYTINVSAELLQRGWMDEYIFVDRISVNATNDTGHTMLFSFEYFSAYEGAFTTYMDGGNYFFETDGIPVSIQTLYVTSLRISYEWDVQQSTITLYGPTNNSYVNVSLLGVIAFFDQPLELNDSVITSTTVDASTSTTELTTTTDSANTTASVTTTEAPQTTTQSPQNTTTSLQDVKVATYNVYPNMSISINGTLYYPCNAIQNNTTPNLTSIYQESNKTFEELIADLTLDANTLSSNTRRYTSARDNRPSATTLGSIGLIVIVSSFSFIVYLDSARLLQEVIKIKNNYKILKKRMSRRSLKIESIDIQCKSDDQNSPTMPDVSN